MAQAAAQTAENSLAENARLFALLNIALADAGIQCWNVKYQFNYWRPVTAIHAADSDGNPNTIADPGWIPLIPTPPFPAYTSGHSTFSAAAAAVLANFFGDDAFTFTLKSETPDAGNRTFTSFSQAAQESGLSRIYGGIHWNFDNEQALTVGEKLGHFVFDNYLQPRETSLHQHSMLGAGPIEVSPTTPWSDLPHSQKNVLVASVSAVNANVPSPKNNTLPQAATAIGPARKTDEGVSNRDRQAPSHHEAIFADFSVLEDWALTDRSLRMGPQ